MKVYVFGNPDIEEDRMAILAGEKLKERLPEVEFKFMGIDDEISFSEGNPIIMDVVAGIEEVEIFENIDEVILPPRVSAHDFDLGFQLKYLRKIGKISGALIIGIPMKKDVDYERIYSILRKLVAQDIQGS